MDAELQGNTTLCFEAQPVGDSGTVRLTVRAGDDVLADEKVDLLRRKAREDFASHLCKDRPGIDRATVDRELLRLAGQTAKPANTSPQAELDVELDLSQFVRPERFITPQVSGVAVPMLAGVGDRPTGRWVLLLQWADGRRGQAELVVKLAMPDGSPLWISPSPAEPTVSVARSLAGWSAAGRQAWLNGAPPPNPAKLFKRLCQQIAHFIDLPADRTIGTTATLAIWIILTYCYPAWDAVPYLYVGGPLGSGKSRVFEILLRLVFRALSSSSMTGAALFRSLHDRGGVLLLDEAERLKQATPETGEILAMLLAGYKRGGQATRLEPVGDTFKTVTFDVFGPKALACITGLPAALASRCITIAMFRAGPESPKPRRRIDADRAVWQGLRDELHALALSNGAIWLDLAQKLDVVPAMSGRDFELWQPLLALASWIESQGAEGLLKVVQDHALSMIEAGQEDQTPDTDETLLRVLAEELLSGQTPTPGEILAKAQGIEAEPFKRWSARGVASRLKRYGLNTHKSAGRKVYGQDVMADLHRVQASYGVDLGLSAPTPLRMCPNVPHVPLRPLLQAKTQASEGT